MILLPLGITQASLVLLSLNRKILHSIPEQGSPTRSLCPCGCSSIKQEHLFEGIVEGEITLEKSGVEGFGYDPIFRPDGYDETFAELGLDVKNTISHRARATQKLAEYLLKV